MKSLKQRVYDYVRKTYRIEPDYPFPIAPTCSVLRHPENRKLFALLMDVPRSRLGLSGEDRVDILNLKCSLALSGVLREQPGILPAYHMHRESWISVLLDGTAPWEEITPLIDLSFSLTADKKVRSAPVNWLIPANPKYYDLPAAIAASPDGSFLWKQSSAVKVGDIVYLYVASPVSGICYKCRATEVDIPWEDSGAQIRMTRVMRLKLQKSYRQPIPLAMLKSHGVTTVRGPRYMPESLIEEIEGKPRD